MDGQFKLKEIQAYLTSLIPEEDLVPPGTPTHIFGDDSASVSENNAENAPTDDSASTLENLGNPESNSSAISADDSSATDNPIVALENSVSAVTETPSSRMPSPNSNNDDDSNSNKQAAAPSLESSEPEDNTLYQIGIDCGSKTVKVCICDENSNIIHSVYRRHRSDIRTTLSEVIHEMNWRYGNLKGSVAVTGSAGISVAEALELPFVQEVVATTKIVKKEYPQADCVIELGGEDAKIIYLTGGLEQRMNATCAGGTGGFIDNIAYLLGVRTGEMDKLAMGASRTYPIASRCAVFAQTDIRPLMNAGARTADLAGSTFDAVVRQTLGGLACGRPITGTVVFLGGPFQYFSDLAVRFRKALDLDGTTGIRPSEAHFFTARGAGLYGAQLPQPHVIDLQNLEDALKTATFRDSGLERLEPLFRNNEERAEFKQRHSKGLIEREKIFFQEGPLYVGIDAGSTAVKVVAVNDKGHLVWGDSKDNQGDVLETAAELLSDMYAEFPREYRGEDTVYIAHAVATGYGEDMLKACLGVDSGIVETTAHVQGALAFAPDASFVLDIGGQDMKAIWVKDGLVQNAVLNEACSSGCGSFISGTAWSLRLQKERFSDAAMYAENPVDLGTKCTVFMNSRLKHAQKVGASANDLAAGCAYSVVKNALFRIIGLENLDSLGNTIVVQGGTFMNDAVLRAFELLSGKNVIRPNRANLMGALGAALVARKRAHTQGNDARSALLSRQELANFSPKRTTRTCEGCANACTLSVVTTAPVKATALKKNTSAGEIAQKEEAPRSYIGGNRCGKALELYASSQSAHSKNAPNAIALQRSLMERIPNCEGTGKRAGIRLGIMNTLATYEYVPFWHEFFRTLGFTVLLPHETVLQHFRVDSLGSDTIPSESVCYPAKLSHRRLKQLELAGATHVFMPKYRRSVNCAVSTEYVCALQDGASLSMELSHHMVSPALPTARPEGIVASDEAKQALFTAVENLAKEAGTALTTQDFHAAFQEALSAQRNHESLVRKANEKALSWVNADEHRHGILLLGRPYHIDAATGHRIDEVLSGLGLAVLSPNVISREGAPRVKTSRYRQPWKKASHMVRLANYALQHQRIDVVALQSFGCLYDGINVIELTEYLQEHKRLATALKIDEITDTAHLRIRLRTLAENIEQVDLAQENELSEAGAHSKNNMAATRIAAEEGANAQLANNSISNNACKNDSEKLVSEDASFAASPLNAQLTEYAKAGSVYAFSHIDAADIETARSHTRDLCYSTAAIVGRSLRILQACPQLEMLTVPNVCHECVLEAIPSILQRISDREITVIWENAWPVDASNAIAKPQDSAKAPAARKTTKPSVGIIGTAPLVFDAFLNDNLVSVIENHGCKAVLSEPENLFTEDIRYLDQLQRFYDAGVRHVIYLQSFGCLKGHVQVRGSMHALAKRFPGMSIVVLDYDPEASALNRENRVLLTLAEALEI